MAFKHPWPASSFLRSLLTLASCYYNEIPEVINLYRKKILFWLMVLKTAVQDWVTKHFGLVVQQTAHIMSQEADERWKWTGVLLITFEQHPHNDLRTSH
jgi:hypothetical protein